MMKMMRSTSMMSTSGMTFGSTIGSALSPLKEIAMRYPYGPCLRALIFRSSEFARPPSMAQTSSRRHFYPFCKTGRQGGKTEGKDGESDRRHTQLGPGRARWGGQDPAGGG